MTDEKLINALLDIIAAQRSHIKDLQSIARTLDNQLEKRDKKERR